MEPNDEQRKSQVEVGLTSNKLSERVLQQQQSGFHPASITAYPWDGAVRYCLVWLK